MSCRRGRGSRQDRGADRLCRGRADPDRSQHNVRPAPRAGRTARSRTMRADRVSEIRGRRAASHHRDHRGSGWPAADGLQPQCRATCPDRALARSGCSPARCRIRPPLRRLRPARRRRRCPGAPPARQATRRPADRGVSCRPFPSRPPLHRASAPPNRLAKSRRPRRTARRKT